MTEETEKLSETESSGLVETTEQPADVRVYECAPGRWLFIPITDRGEKTLLEPRYTDDTEGFLLYKDLIKKDLFVVHRSTV